MIAADPRTGWPGISTTPLFPAGSSQRSSSGKHFDRQHPGNCRVPEGPAGVDPGEGEVSADHDQTAAGTGPVGQRLKAVFAWFEAVEDARGQLDEVRTVLNRKG